MMVEILETVGQPASPELERLARCDAKFRSKRQVIGIPSMNMTVDTHKEYRHASDPRE